MEDKYAAAKIFGHVRKSTIIYYFGVINNFPHCNKNDIINVFLTIKWIHYQLNH